MLPRLAVAVALAVFVVVLASLVRIAFRRWKYPPKPRRRDSDPPWVQVRRQLMADLKRVRRGLRFPYPAEREKHMKWRRRFLLDPAAMVWNAADQIDTLKQQWKASLTPKVPHAA